MGSLMSGWDSKSSAKYKRNHSFTKEGIDFYWKSKKKTEEDHLNSIPFPSPINQEIKYAEEFSELQRSSSLPAMKTDMKAKKTEWWRRSNLAFLNEPPVLEQPSKTYAAQFHIANSKPNNTGIST